jgi:beta-glucosidase
MDRTGKDEAQPIYKNPDRSFEERAQDLVSRMTVAEKISQMKNGSSAVPRLGVPRYNWWNECLHGVAMAGIATVFPQAIGLAATFNQDLLFEVAKIISDEGRAKYHEAQRKGEWGFNFMSVLFGRGLFQGLTFWSPNINIFRDPRWGRGQETYGEDPYLTSQMGIAFVKGLQGDNPKYLKTVATPKHFACYSGPEKGRFSFDSIVSIKDLRETYLFAFKECVKTGNAGSVMGAYNKINGVPCCSNKFLLKTLLREEWGFNGYVVSDCMAIRNIKVGHKYVKSHAQAAACGVKNGCDLECGWTYEHLKEAFKKGLISEDQINAAVTNLFVARLKLGMFDPPEMVPYTSIPFSINDCANHRQMALQAAKESMVLLKNQDNLLPLKRNLTTIAVIGPNADSKKVLLGNYNGTPSKSVTPLEGIRKKVAPQTKVLNEKGCNIKDKSIRGISKALDASKEAEVIIMCLGIDQSLECEDMPWIRHPDRQYLELPPPQQELLEAIHSLGKPMVLVLLNGSPMAIPWVDEHIPAILEAWYPGEEGGTAIADVLFGDYSPAGRLPVTFYRSTADLPPLIDYNMKGRTYRYIEIEPLYPFGYGLSYTRFRYSNLKLSAKEIKIGEKMEITVDVENTGDRKGDEVIQLYLKDIEASARVPHHQLQGFRRISLDPGEKKAVSFTLTPRQMALIKDDGKCVLEPGKFKASVGGSQNDNRSKNLTRTNGLEESFEVIGKEMELEY